MEINLLLCELKDRGNVVYTERNQMFGKNNNLLL